MCENGTELVEVKVEIYDQNDKTCAEGQFSFEGLPTGPALLRVGGDEGTGQVRVHIRENNELLEIAYPVMTEVVILHDNDLHLNFHHIEEFTEKVNSFRIANPDVFLMNAGDIVVRHAHRWPIEDEMYYGERSRMMIEIMNRIGYDVMTMGNHELGYIGDHTRKALERARFPLLGANIEIETDKLPAIKPYMIMETHNGHTIAVLGLTGGGFDNRDGVGLRNPFEVAGQYAHLAEKHDLFVALTHIGYNNDRRLASSVDFIDVIVGGHCHTMLREAEHVGGTLVAQAGGHSHEPETDGEKYLGVIKLLLRNGRLIESRGDVRIISISGVQ